jgi:hypothetical protein
MPYGPPVFQKKGEKGNSARSFNTTKRHRSDSFESETRSPRAGKQARRHTRQPDPTHCPYVPLTQHTHVVAPHSTFSPTPQTSPAADAWLAYSDKMCDQTRRHLTSPSHSSHPHVPSCSPQHPPIPAIQAVVDQPLATPKTGPRCVSTCEACGSTSFIPRNGIEKEQVLKELSGAGVVLSVLKRQKLTLGKFLHILLTTPSEDLSDSTRKSLSSFLKGNGKHSAVDVVRAIYEHPFSRRTGPPAVMIPPSFSFSPVAVECTEGIPSQAATEDEAEARVPRPARVELRNYFVEEVCKEVGKEMVALTKDDNLRGAQEQAGQRYTWTFLMGVSFDALQSFVVSTAPILWTLLTSAAMGEKRAGHLKQVYAARKGEGRGSNHSRDPWLVCLQSPNEMTR